MEGEEEDDEILGQDQGPRGPGAGVWSGSALQCGGRASVVEL